MKVKELIEILRKLDQEKDICITDNETGIAYYPAEIINFDEEENAYIL